MWKIRWCLRIVDAEQSFNSYHKACLQMSYVVSIRENRIPRKRDFATIIVSLDLFTKNCISQYHLSSPGHKFSIKIFSSAGNKPQQEPLIDNASEPCNIKGLGAVVFLDFMVPSGHYLQKPQINKKYFLVNSSISSIFKAKCDTDIIFGSSNVIHVPHSLKHFS